MADRVSLVVTRLIVSLFIFKFFYFYFRLRDFEERVRCEREKEGRMSGKLDGRLADG